MTDWIIIHHGCLDHHSPWLPGSSITMAAWIIIHHGCLDHHSP
jgi:hypothetical protein